MNAAGAGDDCPRQLTRLTVLDGPHAGAAVPTVPAGGGTPVRLEGFFVSVDNVLVNGKPVEFEGPQFGPFVFYAPPADGVGSARVTVEATPPVSGEAVLFFADPTPPGPTPATHTTSPPSEPPETGLPTVGPPAAEAPPLPPS